MGVGGGECVLGHKAWALWWLGDGEAKGESFRNPFSQVAKA